MKRPRHNRRLAVLSVSLVLVAFALVPLTVRLAHYRRDYQKLKTKGFECQAPGVWLPYARLAGVELNLANLQNACLIRADLRKTLLVHTDFSGANLSGANLQGALGNPMG